MNFHQLKSFYFAVKYGSLSAAADALYITQPAVTKQIQQLQATYGVKLLNRFGKKMVPTDAGEVLFDFADKIFQFESQAEESLRDFQQRKSGRLRIHASESFGAYYLPFIINLFRKKYPKIHISVNIFPNQEIVENTVKLENDMGFISYPIEHKKLLAQEILEDRLVLIVPTSHPLAKKRFLEPRQLDGQSIVMHERGSASREIVDGFIKRHNISVSIPLELSNNEAIKRAVEEGIGLSLISEHVVKEEVKRKKLKSIPLIDPALIRKFYLIYHKEKYLSQPFQMFISMVNQWASEYRNAYAGKPTLPNQS
ncbi:MAG: LysR family transcriptional regulator [Deltaproteobacteria bacterium]|nr:LysR family transcriptional regulator [Deltaproteobacteria bacterium]